MSREASTPRRHCPIVDVPPRNSKMSVLRSRWRSMFPRGRGMLRIHGDGAPGDRACSAALRGGASRCRRCDRSEGVSRGTRSRVARGDSSPAIRLARRSTCWLSCTRVNTLDTGRIGGLAEATGAWRAALRRSRTVGSAGNAGDVYASRLEVDNERDPTPREACCGQKLDSRAHTLRPRLGFL